MILYFACFVWGEVYSAAHQCVRSLWYILVLHRVIIPLPHFITESVSFATVTGAEQEMGTSQK